MTKMKPLFLTVAFAVGACAADVADYCRDVVEPALAGVFSSWTVRGPNAEIVASVCTNVDWRIVRRWHSRDRDVWIGGEETGTGISWRLGVCRERGGTFTLDARLWPFSEDPSMVTNTCASNAHVRVIARAAGRAEASAPLAEAKRLVVAARELRLKGRGPAASKMLRKADMQDPLCAWSAMERAFLEDEGDGVVDAARAGRARPDVSVSRCRDAYLEIGATNEVRLIDKQLKETGGMK